MHKIVVSRDLGPQVMPILQGRKEFHVSRCSQAWSHYADWRVQLVVCPDDVKDRQGWLKEHVPGAEGLLCMLSDKVCLNAIDSAVPDRLCDR